MSTTITATTTSFKSSTTTTTVTSFLSCSPTITDTPTASSLANSQLTAINKISELHQLRDLYRRDWPAHCVGYYCLSNFIDWLEKRQQLSSVEDMKNLQIFTLDNDWHSDGLFLIVDRYQLFVNSLLSSAASPRLTKAVSLLDWSWLGFKVSSFCERHRPSVLNIVRAKQLPIEYDSLTPMYYMPRAEVLKLPINCPVGYKLRSLNSKTDAQVIDTLWPNRHQGSLFVIQRLIEWNTNIGVYTDDTNELVAWCLRLQGGFLGALQVKESHQRRGLGSLVTAAISRRIAEQGDDAMALVGQYNHASCGMFDRLGFTVVDNCYWLRTFPIKDVERLWPDVLKTCLLTSKTTDSNPKQLNLFIQDRYQLFVNSLLSSAASPRLTKAVSLLDWSWLGFKVSSFCERHRPSVLNIVRAKQLPIEYDSLTPMYYMPRAEVLKLPINCPVGYKLRSLNSKTDAQVIDTLWPNRHQGSLFVIQRLIEWNTNIGVYTDDTNELVAWCLRLQGGFLGALQVKESHQRRGLGSLVTAAISRRIAEQGDDAMALVGQYNHASCGMFDRLGFTVVDNCYWLRTFPIKDVERLWPDGE